MKQVWSVFCGIISYAVCILLLPVLYIVWQVWAYHEMRVLMKPYRCFGGDELAELMSERDTYA